MKFLSLTLILLLLSGFLFAQTYAVPGAQLQPAWVFPMWFENGDGQKDTLYFCFDPQSGFPSDTLFGVKLIPENTDTFNATFDQLLYNDSMHLKVIVLTTDVLSAGVGIKFQNGVLPITLRWDKNVFYSDSIPYPEKDPAPRAQGKIWFDLPMNVDSCNYSVPIIMTDSVTTYYSTCYKSDSIIFNGNGISYLTFSVDPWKGYWLNAHESHQKNSVNFYPNPSSGEIKITAAEQYDSYELLDLAGRKIFGRQIIQQGSTTEIKLLRLSPGSYLIRLFDSLHNNFLIRKIEIQ